MKPSEKQPIYASRAAELLAVSDRTVQRWCKSGLPHARGKRGYLVTRHSLREWLAKHRTYLNGRNFSPETRRQLREFVDNH